MEPDGSAVRLIYMTGTLLDAECELPPSGRLDATTVRDPALARSVRTTAVAVLARTLEVLDGRRPRAQLAGAVTEAVLGQITVLLQHGALGHGAGRQWPAGTDDCARLHRVHVQFRAGTAAEIFGTLQCGERVRALAGRLERRRVRVSAPGEVPRRVAERWVLTEFAVL